MSNVSIKPIIILENIRSAFNVGSILRTADALWYDVILSWYTPHPDEKMQISKTSLWAEKHVFIKRFWNTSDTFDYISWKWCKLFVWETGDDYLPLHWIWWDHLSSRNNFALLVWNEKTWVTSESLARCDYCVWIPMNWFKESLNVSQAAAILMWHFSFLSQ